MRAFSACPTRRAAPGSLGAAVRTPAPRRAAVRGAALSPEQQERAIATQLARSGEVTPLPAAEPAATLIPPRQEAPPKAQPADAAAVAASEAAQGGVRERVDLLPRDKLDAALQRQTGSGSPGEGGEGGEAGGGEGAGGEEAEASASRTAPAATFEDGSLLFTSDLLGSVNYEDLLTP